MCDKTARGREWLAFSNEVLAHIENYTVPQYGDKGEDPMTDYTPEELVKQVEKYMKRFGKNIRPGQQHMDFLKAAHCLAIAATKLQENTDATAET